MTKLRQLWLLTALAAVAILAGGYFLLVSPQSSKASSLRKDAAAQETTNQSLQSQINLLNQQKKLLPAKEAVLAKFAGKIPPNPGLPALIRSLSDAADRSGVLLVSLTPSSPTFSKGVDAKGNVLAGNIPAPNGTVLATIPVGVEVHGHYSNLTQFLAELENLNRALLVAGFDVTRQAGANKRPAAAGTGTTGNAASTFVDPDTLIMRLTTNVMMTTKAPVAATAPVVNSDAVNAAK